MRNLSVAESLAVITVSLLAAALAHSVWLQPVLDQMHSDRLATRTLLFELAAARPTTPDRVGATEASTLPAQAAVPTPTQAAPKTRRRRRSLAPSKPAVLDLGQGSDPLWGMDSAR